MCVLFIGEAKNAEARAGHPVEDLVMQQSEHPIAAVPAIGEEGPDEPRLAAMLARERQHGREIALEIAACESEARREIGMLADTPIEAQRRRDLRPVGAD